VASWCARDKRRKSHLDPSLGLFRTHSFPVGTSNIFTGTVFPVRTEPVTFSCKIATSTATPAGVVFELGSSTTGLAVWIAAADRKLMAAVGDSATDDGVTLTGPVCRIGQVLRICLSCIPASGKARLWVNGHLVAAGTAVSLLLPHGWSDGEAGAVGNVRTSITTRVAVGDRIALTGAAVVEPVYGHQNQRPRQFSEMN